MSLNASESADSTALPGIVIILSGPTAVGKNTVGDELMKADSSISRVVTATTRAPRGSEQDGVDYHFLTHDEFRAKIEAGEFLEHAEVHGQLYGTPRQSVVDLLDAGRSALLIIDVDGGEAVEKIEPDALSIFLMPPSIEALHERIRNRGTEDPAAIERRLQRVDREIGEAKRYQHRVTNDDLSTCAKEIAAIIEQKRAEMAEKLSGGATLFAGIRGIH